MAALLRKPEHFLPLMWGSLCVVLAVVIAAEFFLGRPTAGQGPRPPARVAQAGLLPPFALPTEAATGSETTSRPLFTPGRRPAPPAIAVDAVAMKKGQFVLQGTTVIGDLSFAMLKEIATGKVHRVKKGDKVLDMTLAEVSPTSVVLALGTDSETLALLVAKGGGQPGPAVSQQGPFTPSRAQGGAAPGAAAPNRGAAPVPGATVPAAVQPRPASAAAPGTANPTPEEIIARRRAARRAQGQN